MEKVLITINDVDILDAVERPYTGKNDGKAKVWRTCMLRIQKKIYETTFNEGCKLVDYQGESVTVVFEIVPGFEDRKPQLVVHQIEE